jgi:hypothetical protein
MLKKLGPTLVAIFGVVALAYAQMTTIEKLRFSGSNCVISSGASAPSGGSTCDVYVKSDGTLYVNAGSAWGSVGAIQSASVSLTDAQIKTLPTAAVTLVAAPGAGKYINLIHADLFIKRLADYTNINATDAFLVLSLGSFGASWDQTLYLVNDGSATPAQTEFGNFFGGGVTSNRTSVTGGYMLAASDGWPPFMQSQDGASSGNVINKPLIIYGGNGGSGNLTGGNAGNSLRVKVFYSVEDVIP